MDSPETYDEQEALTNYVVQNYPDLMPEHGWAKVAGPLVEDDEGPHPPAELPDGFLERYAHVIVVNRCPECDRILRTSQAQQCLWCGHDWH